MSEPNRLTLVITSIEAGGAERVLSDLANQWADEGRTITLVTLHHARDDFFVLDRRITRVALDVLQSSTGTVRAAWSNVSRIRTLRRVIRASAPEVVIAFTDQTNILTLFATRGLGVPVIVSERTNPTVQRLGRMWEKARRLSYKWAARVVVQTHAVRRWAETFLEPARVVVIPNALTDVGQRDTTDVPPGSMAGDSFRPFVVAMGRLEPAKGFLDLVRVFARLSADFPDWKLVVLGEGPQRALLESEAAALGIAGRVRLPGLVKRPGRILTQAEIFVLSSSHEGFPNALLEAMACGCASVSFDCPSGPSDIIEHGVNGLLVPAGDTRALAEAIRALILQPELRAALAAAARGVSDRFAAPAILRQWNDVLEHAR